MNNEILTNNLRHVLQSPVVADEERLKTLCLLARGEIQRRQGRERISFARFLCGQVRFMGWKIWCAQGMLLLFLCGILARLNSLYPSPQSMIRILFCLSVLVFMTALPLLSRSVRYRMQEVEAASRFSCVRLLLAKLIVIGIGDVFLLGGIFLATLITTSLPAGGAFLYVCFPFLLTGSACLYMLGHFPPERFFAGNLLLCFVLTLTFCSIPGRYTSLLLQSPSAAPLVTCALLFAFCAWQLRYLIKHSPYTEMQVA